MKNGVRTAASVGGAVVLSGYILTGAWAQGPGQAQELVRALSGHTIPGTLQVNGVLRVKKNTSIYGVTYAHGGEQVWKSLLVRDGLKVDTINDSGPLQAQSANVANALQAGTITGTSINSTGNGDFGGSLSVQSKITGNGVDAGAGGVTTTGVVSGGSFTSAGNVAAGGTLSAGGATTLSGGLTVAGNVNFTNATVSGLNLSSLNLNNATVNSFTVGSQAGTTAPLNLSSNGRTASVGVNGSGQVAVDGLAVNTSASIGGTLAVSGSGGITTPLVAGSSVSGSGSGPITIQGSGITLSGPVTIGSQGDLLFANGPNAFASHILAGSDGDIAGVTSVTEATGTSPSGGFTTSVSYSKPFDNEPAVTVTPTQDPAPGAPDAKIWVSSITNSNGRYTGFTVHIQPTGNGVSTQTTVRLYYHVIGTNR